MRSKTSTSFSGAISAGAIGLIVVCVLAAAMLIADRPASQSPAKPQEPPKTAAPTAKRIPTSPVPVQPVAASKTPVASASVAAAAPVQTNPSLTLAKAAAQEPAAVTITGCLQQDDETFRLKETSGVDAPKSRSWKSGFLKKRSATIDIVDAGNRLQLRSYVGQRVMLTGKLRDREMQARSLLRVSSSCN